MNLTITIRNLAEISYVNDEFDDEIVKLLTIQNPKYLENERMERWQGDTPKQLTFYEQDDNRLYVPRGAIASIIKICNKRNIKPTLIDETIALPNTSFNFNGTLHPFQETAVAKMLPHEEGTLCAPTGSGKTVVALYMIAERKQPSLIIVHTKGLLSQWQEKIKTFLGIPKRDIGQIGDDEIRIGEKITIALIQSLRNIKNLPMIGHLIADECHRIPGTTFYETIKKFNCKYLLGLSATPYRRDGLTKLIHWYAGPIQYKIDPRELMRLGYISKIRPIIRRTNFISQLKDPSTEFSKLLSEITKDKERNQLITTDVTTEANQGETCLILTDRKEHCLTLETLLDHSQLKVSQLTGDHSTEHRDNTIEKINDNNLDALIATSQLLGEWFDCENISAVFLAIPISSAGRLIQYIGRGLRPKPGKEFTKIYDYHDPNVRCLYNGFKARLKVYKDLEQ